MSLRCDLAGQKKYFFILISQKSLTILDRHYSSNSVLGSSSQCTNCFHVSFSSSVLSRGMARACNGGKGNSGSNSQCGCRILGQRGNTEMGRVSMLSCFIFQWDPNPFFYRPKEIVMVGVNGYGKSNG
jgi:hypothetical protein